MLSPSDCYPVGPTGQCVAGGPVGPDDYLQVLEPFEQLVLDHADPAGQHAVIQDTVDSLEHPRMLPETILDGGLVEKISDWVPDTTLDGQLMEGTTYLEHSALRVSLDSGLMEGMLSPEPLEQSVLNTLWVARPGRGITEEISDWEPVAHPVPDATLDGRLMEGTTYLEHSVMGVSLDSGLMQGMSSHWSSRFLIRCRPHGRKKVSQRRYQRSRFRKLHWTVDLWRGLLTWSIRFWGCLWTVDSWRGC